MCEARRYDKYCIYVLCIDELLTVCIDFCSADLGCFLGTFLKYIGNSYYFCSLDLLCQSSDMISSPSAASDNSYS